MRQRRCLVALAVACVGQDPPISAGALDAGTADATTQPETSTTDGPSEATAPTCSQPCDFATGQTQPHGIAVDGTHVYWTNRTVPGAVLRKPKVDSEVIETLAAGQDAPTAVAVTPTHAFWLTTSPPRVVRYGLATRQTSSVAANVDVPQQLFAGGNRLFYTGESQNDGTTRGIHSSSEAFDAPLAHDTTIGARALAVEADGSTAYYARFAVTGELRSIDQEGNIRRQSGISADVPDWNNLYAIALSDTDVYWTSAAGVFRQAKATFGEADVFATPLSTVSDARGIVVDRARQRAYFVTGSGGVYASAGSGAEKIAQAECEGAFLAQDDTSLYWTCGSFGTLKRMTKR